MEKDGLTEDMDADPTWQVTLSFSGPFPPHVTTQWLGLEPSRGYLSDVEAQYEHENGEFGPGPWWIWELDSRVPIYGNYANTDVNGLNHHIGDILDQLEPHWDKVLALPDRGYWVTLFATLPLANRYVNGEGDLETGRTNAVILATSDIFRALGKIYADLEAHYVMPGSGKL